jgi:CheY-like chemotaxis protein
MEDNNQKKKILVVEDEKDAMQIYLDILNGADFIAKGAANGREALDLLESEKFDLVLLDIIMPEMDGLETLQNIKKFPAKYGDMKILMLSNIGGDIAIDKAMKIGADGYMLKSETEPMDLINIVNKYLE